jgi:hypothetical protein
MFRKERMTNVGGIAREDAAIPAKIKGSIAT